MYTRRNNVYADPYKVLVGAGVCGLKLPAAEGLTETDAPLDDMRRQGSIVTWGAGRCACLVEAGADYATYKTRLIKAHYSVDDQIAVMLNGEAEELRRMQAWREWAADVAHKIMEVL